MSEVREIVYGHNIPPVNKTAGEVVDHLMEGAIDMHMHAGPDPGVARWDPYDIACAARDHGMRAVVLKSFLYPTAIQADMLKNLVPEVDMIGSVTIGQETTMGLAYAKEVIELNAKLGAKVVWFPAMDAEFFRKERGLSGGIKIIDEQGKLKEEVYKILEVIKKYELVLCSGHMEYIETETLFKQAREMGITKMVATHPQVNEWTPMTLTQMKTLAGMGAYIEHCGLQLTARSGSMHPTRFVEITKEIGAEHCIMSTDFGWASEAVEAEAMRSFVGSMMMFGCTEEEIDYMIRKNPMKLLGLPERYVAATA